MDNSNLLGFKIFIKVAKLSSLILENFKLELEYRSIQYFISKLIKNTTLVS